MEFDELIKDIREDELSKEELEEKLKEEPKEEAEETSSKFKKTFVFIMGIMLIVLMFSYIFAGYPISNIIEGWLESEPLQDNVIQLENFSVIFENKVREGLQQIYFAEQKVEFGVCLLGEKIGQDYYINELYLPQMFEQSFNRVSFAPCSADTLIVLHSHPYKSCLASAADLATLEKNKKINPDVLMVVMCEPERFSVYS